jgi:sulfoxide reductase heme-binding subunit YedZ
MTLPLAAGSVSWYLTRSTGAVALLLLTASVVLGVADVRRLSSERWPRFVIDALHRNVALLSICFLGVHIITAVLDTFTSIPIVDAVVPFIGSYRPFWLGLGAVSFDLLIAVTITSLLRQRLGYATWRAVHWLSYASWPIALVHGLGTGSDTNGTWMLTLDLLCLVAVLGALGSRLSGVWPDYPERGRLTLGGAGVFLVFLAFWVPSGPLGTNWAKRSGTPTPNLHHTPAGAKR